MTFFYTHKSMQFCNKCHTLQYLYLQLQTYDTKAHRMSIIFQVQSLKNQLPFFLKKPRVCFQKWSMYCKRINLSTYLQTNFHFSCKSLTADVWKHTENEQTISFLSVMIFEEISSCISTFCSVHVQSFVNFTNNKAINVTNFTQVFRSSKNRDNTS